MNLRTFSVGVLFSVFTSSLGFGAQLSLDAGAMLTNVVGRTQTSSSLQGQVSRLSPYFRFRTHFALSRRWGFEPAWGLLLPWRKGADGSVKTLSSRLEIPIAFGGTHSRFRLGTGVELNMILPSGAAVELNNGVGTSTFYIPSLPRGALLFLVHGGGVIRLAKWLALTIDVYVTGIGSPTRRRIHSALGFAWVL